MIKIFMLSLFLMVNIAPFKCYHSDEHIDDLTNNYEYDENKYPLSLELQNAVISNDIKKVEGLLKTGKNINEKDEHGRTALHYASLLLLPNIVELLLNKGANINDQDEIGLTPLMFACIDHELIHQKEWPFYPGYHLKTVLEEAQSYYYTENYMKVFRLLIDKNPDVNKISNYELRALHYASSNYYTVAEQIELLIKHGADVNAVDFRKNTALHYVKKGAIALSLLKNQANVNARNDNGATPLHKVRSDKVASILIKFKADINAINSLGLTPLHQIQDPHIIRILLLSNASVNIPDKRGDTALHEASINGLTRKVDYLLLHGANVNATNNGKETPLHNAANPEIIDLLVQHGADINAKNDYESTPLLSVRLNQKSTFENLEAFIRHGATVNISNYEGSTLLHRVATFCDKDVASYLIHHGSNINAKDIHGYTPLHYASDHNLHLCHTYDMVKVLLDAGADVNAQSNENGTPLHLAAEYGEPETFRLLLAYKPDFNLKNSKGQTAFETIKIDNYTRSF